MGLRQTHIQRATYQLESCSSETELNKGLASDHHVTSHEVENVEEPADLQLCFAEGIQALTPPTLLLLATPKCCSALT
jgi:hypothetical protein